MSIDAKAKIDEMLRLKREGTNINKTQTPVSTIIPVVEAQTTNSKVIEENSNSSALAKINEILRQKQASNDQKNQPTAQKTVAISSDNTTVQSVVEAVKQFIPPTPVKNRYGLCPLCLADLEVVDGVYACPNCNQYFVRRANQGDLINCSDLPYGYCKCCELRFPLAKTQNSEDLFCSASKEKYLLSGKGYLRATELPFGLCSCCQPANPLVATQDRAIRCINTNEEYIKNVDGTVVRKPVEVNLSTNQNIETALNQGMAAFYYGGFIGNQEPEPPPAQVPKRQRRRWFL